MTRKKTSSGSGASIGGNVTAGTFIGHDQNNHHYGFSAQDVAFLVEKLLPMLRAGAAFTPREDDRFEIELQNERLVFEPGIWKRLENCRDEQSYLLGLTLNQDYCPWATLYVPLSGEMDAPPRARPGRMLPRCFQEVILPPTGSRPEAQVRFVDLEDITEALQKYPALIILGEPGAGKTTTLQKIMQEEAQRRLAGEPGRIPLLINLSDQNGRSIPAFLKEEWERHVGGSFEDALAQGRLLALLDGVNEIPRDLRDPVLKNWHDFVQKDGGANQFVFTGRYQDYAGTLKLPRVVIKELDPPRIRDYLRRFEAEALQEKLDEPHSRLGELAKNPFYLMLLTNAYLDDQHNLDNRGRLLGWFVKKLLGREHRRNHPDWIEEEAFCGALARLAFDMLEQRRGTTCKYPDALAALPETVRARGETWKIKPDTLFRLGRQATLLDPAVENDVRFFHHLLLEYFAALELLRRFAAGEDLSRLWRAPRLGEEMPPADAGEWDPLPPPPSTGWEVTTLLAVGLAGQLLADEIPGGKRHPGKPEALLQAVRGVNPALAGRGLLEAGLDGLKPLVPGGLAAGLETEEPALKAELEAAREALHEELYAPAVHLRARLQAGEVLGRLGDPRLKVEAINGVRVILPEMSPVPGGRYRIGSRRNDAESYDDEKPSFEIELADFSIGRRPVTNAEFACFIEAGGYANPAWWQTELARRWLAGEEVAGGQMKGWLNNWQYMQNNPNWRKDLRSSVSPDQMKTLEYVAGLSREELIRKLSTGLQQKSRTEPAYWHREGWNLPNQPVTGVTWFEAAAYCAWLSAASGKTFGLPPEPCWEAAARGMDGNAYPWGMEWQAESANTIEGRVMRPSPAGAYAAGGGLGPGGAEDQAGNVWEWTASLYLPYPYEAQKAEQPEAEGERTLRGGAWRGSRRFARCAARYRIVPDDFDYVVGFRLFSPGHF